MIMNEISYSTHEVAMAYAERTTKRLWILCIVLAAIILITNAFWIYEWTRYDYVSTESQEIVTYQQDGSGTNIIGNDNEVNNGTNQNNGENNQNQE